MQKSSVELLKGLFPNESNNITDMNQNEYIEKINDVNVLNSFANAVDSEEWDTLENIIENPVASQETLVIVADKTQDPETLIKIANNDKTDYLVADAVSRQADKLIKEYSIDEFGNTEKSSLWGNPENEIEQIFEALSNKDCLTHRAVEIITNNTNVDNTLCNLVANNNLTNEQLIDIVENTDNTDVLEIIANCENAEIDCLVAIFDKAQNDDSVIEIIASNKNSGHLLSAIANNTDNPIVLANIIDNIKERDDFDNVEVEGAESDVLNVVTEKIINSDLDMEIKEKLYISIINAPEVSKDTVLSIFHDVTEDNLDIYKLASNKLDQIDLADELINECFKEDFEDCVSEFTQQLPRFVAEFKDDADDINLKENDVDKQENDNQNDVEFCYCDDDAAYD